MKKITRLDGTELYFEEVEGEYKEVEKKELIGGVFEYGEHIYRISHGGKVYKDVVWEDDEYAIERGQIWKTREEAERKVEIDNLIEKYRITDREVLEDSNILKCILFANIESKELRVDSFYYLIIGHCFMKEDIRKLIKLITYVDWTKYELLWR